MVKQDYEKAKKILAEAGYAEGLELSVDVGNTKGSWQQSVCEIMVNQLKSAGITLKLNVVPATKYWEIWDKTPFGKTNWTHRSLGTMVLSFYSNPEFDKALGLAESLVDVEQRRVAMEKVQSILQNDSVMVQPLW